MTSTKVKEASLVIRNATLDDVPNISALIEKVYPDIPAVPLNAIKSQIQHMKTILNEFRMKKSQDLRKTPRTRRI